MSRSRWCRPAVITSGSAAPVSLSIRMKYVAWHAAAARPATRPTTSSFSPDQICTTVARPTSAIPTPIAADRGTAAFCPNFSHATTRTGPENSSISATPTGNRLAAMKNSVWQPAIPVRPYSSSARQDARAARRPAAPRKISTSGTSSAAAPRIRSQAACSGVKPAPINAFANGPEPPNVTAENTAKPSPTDFVLYMGITLSCPLHPCRG